MPLYYKPLSHGAIVFTAPNEEMALEMAAHIAPLEDNVSYPLQEMPDPAYVRNDQGFEFCEAEIPGPGFGPWGRWNRP